MPLDHPATAPVSSDPRANEDTPTADERWAAWKAKGVAQDRAFRRKLWLVAPAIGVAVALAVYVWLRS